MSSSGQAGHARALTTSPGGLKSLKRIVKQCPGSTAACWANDTENTLVQPLIKSDSLLWWRCTVFDLCPRTIEKNPCGSQYIWRHDQAGWLRTIKHRLLDDKNGIHTRQVLQLLFTSQTFPIHFFRQDRGFCVWKFGMSSVLDWKTWRVVISTSVLGCNMSNTSLLCKS